MSHNVAQVPVAFCNNGVTNADLLASNYAICAQYSVYLRELAC